MKSSRLSWAISEVLHQPGSQKTGRGLGERKERGGEEKKKGNIHNVSQPWKQCSTHLKDQKEFGLMFTIRKSHQDAHHTLTLSPSLGPQFLTMSRWAFEGVLLGSTGSLTDRRCTPSLHPLPRQLQWNHLEKTDGLILTLVMQTILTTLIEDS